MELKCPESNFLTGYWAKVRAGDNLESVYWLYNRSGEKWLLTLAAKIHRCADVWSSGLKDWHGVNLSQGFREPAIYWMQAKAGKFLKAAYDNYDSLMAMYGQFPGGGIAADENCRPGYTDPRQATETCAWVEFMHSFEMLAKLSGDPLWADRCEEIAMNSFSSIPDARPQSPALSDGRQHGAVGPQQQIARLAGPRNDAFLQSV